MADYFFSLLFCLILKKRIKMLSNSAIKFKATIDLSTKDINGVPNPDYRKITFTDVTDYTGENLTTLKGYFSIINPTGTVLHLGNVTTPDIDQDVSMVFDSVSVPLDSLGNLLSGYYKIQYFVEQSGTIVYNTEEVSVLICDDDCDNVTNGDLEIDINCDSAVATAYDRTEYASGSEVERVLTLRPPLGSKYSNGTVASTYSTTNNYVNSDALWSGVWEAHLVAIVTHTDIVGGFEFKTIEYVDVYDNAEATCSINLCALYSCITQTLEKVKKQASDRGGLGNNVDLHDFVSTIEMEYISMEVARSCGNKTKVVEHYNKLKELLGCDCGCGNSTSPTLIEAILPTVNNINVVGSSPITVISSVSGGTTTYTISLSASFLNVYNALKKVNVVSLDGSVNVTETAPDAYTKQFDLSVDIDDVTASILATINPACLGLVAPNNTFKDVLQELINRACEPPAPPVATNDYYATTEGVMVSIEQFLNDFSNSGITTTISTAPINGVAVITGSNKIEYTPNGGFTGVETFQYTIEDIYGQTSTATITVVVNPTTSASCATVNASYVLDAQVDGTTLTLLLSNQTNYSTNAPVSVQYFISVEDASNVAIHTYAPISGNNSATPPTTFVFPDAVDTNWHHIRVVMWVITESATGDTCGTVIYEAPSPLLIPDIGLSMYSGVDVSCLGTAPTATDTEITQALVDKACVSGVLVENGLSGTGVVGDKVKLGGGLTEDTEIDGGGSYKLDFDELASFSVRSGGLVGATTEREYSAHEMPSNYEAPNGFSILRKQGIIHLNAYTLTNGNGLFNESQNAIIELSANQTIPVGSLLCQSVEQLQITTDDANRSLTASDAGSGIRFIGNKVIRTNLNSGHATNKVTVNRCVNHAITTVGNNGQAWNQYTTFIQQYIGACKGNAAESAPAGTFTNSYGIYQDGADDDNLFMGDVQNAGGVTQFTSDIRAKKNIKDYEVGLDAIRQINTKTFEYVYKSGKEIVGVIAQELESIIPSAVTEKMFSFTGENGDEVTIEDFKMVEQGRLFYAMLNAIKELDTKNKSLEERLAKIEAKLGIND